MLPCTEQLIGLQTSLPFGAGAMPIQQLSGQRRALRQSTCRETTSLCPHSHTPGRHALQVARAELQLNADQRATVRPRPPGSLASHTLHTCHLKAYLHSLQHSNHSVRISFVRQNVTRQRSHVVAATTATATSCVVIQT